MTENIPQTSASDRIERARKALAAAAMYGVAPGMSAQREARMVLDLTDALRALITPPSVGESVSDMALGIHAKAVELALRQNIPVTNDLDSIIRNAVNSAMKAGIQYAHERWEPADHPSQEQMLRWLGIEYREYEKMLIVPDQVIEREEI